MSITPLGPGGLHAIQHPIRLDGRFSMYASHERGWTSGNVYLFVGRRQALLIETGFGAYEAALIEDVRSVLPRGMPLVLYALRWSEMNSTCNLRSLIEEFNVDRLIGSGAATLRGMEVRPRLGQTLLDTASGGRDPEMTMLTGKTAPIDIDGDGRWVLSALTTPLHLLSTRWIHDPASKTLLTSDSFTHCTRDAEEGPWITRADEPVPAIADIRRHLFGSRYWWIPDAETTPIVRELSELFAHHEIERLAPSYGCIIEGRDAVRRHIDLLLAALKGEK